MLSSQSVKGSIIYSQLKGLYNTSVIIHPTGLTIGLMYLGNKTIIFDT